MIYNIPNAKPLEINTIILDLNGTLTVFGKVVTGAPERINKLKAMGMHIVLFTGDIRGTAAQICTDLGIDFEIAHTNAEKGQLIRKYDQETTASIGNACIDIATFQYAKLSIATLQGEGINVAIIPHIDIIVPSINDALDLLIDGKALAGSLRH